VPAPATTGPAVCPACGGELRLWRTVASAEPGLGDERYDLLRCTTCRSAVTVGESAPALYETGAYRPGTPRLHASARPALRQFDRQRLAFVRALHPPPARLLDVGAGRGRFVLAAAGAGYRATGLEPSARGIEAAAALGAAVSQAGVEDADVDADSLDVITLWHVLEHLDDPGAALSRLRGWLRPGGGLLVGVPNLDSLQARIGGARWYHLDVPRHRVHFTSAGIQALLWRRGFEVVGVRHLLLEHNPFGMWQSWLSRLTAHPSYVYNLLKRNAPLRSPDLALSVAMLPLAPVAALVELGAGLARLGGTVAVLARRRA
jgi:SAM-dependent methyltransferase